MEATILFVTHFDKLVSYLNSFPNVKQVTISVEAGKNHELSEGPRKVQHSGVAMLEKLLFPQEIQTFSKEMLRIVLFTHPNEIYGRSKRMVILEWKVP